MSLAALAALLSALFAAVVATRWQRSGRPAFAAWAVGLVIFAGAALAQALGQARGFDELTFRVFYLLGGVLGVAFLSLGTIHLLASRRVARIASAVLVALSVLLAIDGFLEPVASPALTTSAGVLGGAFEHQWSPVRIGAVVLNVVGSIILIGGSGYSAWRLYRIRSGVDRVVCNVMITAGALLIAAGFSAAKTANGGLDALGAAEAVGIAIMFGGFLALGRRDRPGRERSTLPGADPAAP